MEHSSTTSWPDRVAIDGAGDRQRNAAGIRGLRIDVDIARRSGAVDHRPERRLSNADSDDCIHGNRHGNRGRHGYPGAVQDANEPNRDCQRNGDHHANRHGPAHYAHGKLHRYSDRNREPNDDGNVGLQWNRDRDGNQHRNEYLNQYRDVDGHHHADEHRDEYRHQHSNVDADQYANEHADKYPNLDAD